MKINMLGYDAVVLRENGGCSITITRTVFDVEYVWFKDTPEFWSAAFVYLTRVLSMTLKERRDQDTQPWSGRRSIR